MNVIVHGAQSVSEDWNEVAHRIGGADVPDRRGRKGVPLPSDYSLQTEVDDLHRVLDQHPNPVLVGHSYGGLIALVAAQERDDLRAVVLYEPAVHIDPTALNSFDAAMAAGDRDQALEIVVRDVAALEPWRDADPASWLAAQALLDTTQRELHQVAAFAYQPPKIKAPVTVVLGERSERLFGATARRIAEDTNGLLVTMPGEDHVAHVGNPDLVATIIRTASERSSTLSA